LGIPAFLIFDLDDTILDYSAPAEKIWPRLYRKYSRRLNLPLDRLSRAADESRRWYWSDMDRFREGRLDLKRARRLFVRDAFAKIGCGNFEAADALADDFTRERETVVKPFPGAVQALVSFRRNGARMALLTNGAGPVQRAKIKRFGLARFFDSILIEGETGIGKPDERAFRAALESLDADPPQAWMIGDNLEFDILPAKALGMRAAWIRGRSTAAADYADCAAPSLRELAVSWRSDPTDVRLDASGGGPDGKRAK
jgi:putative hydrolase of the HAD superfamily